MAEDRAPRGYSDGAYLQARAHGNSNKFQDTWLTGDRPLWLTNQGLDASNQYKARCERCNKSLNCNLHTIKTHEDTFAHKTAMERFHRLQSNKRQLVVYNASGHLALQPHGNGSVAGQADEADSDSENEEVGSRQAAADMETAFGELEEEEEEEGSELGSELVELYAIPARGRWASLVPASDFQQHVDSARQELAATAVAVVRDLHSRFLPPKHAKGLAVVYAHYWDKQPSDEDFLEHLAIVKARYCMEATLANGQRAPALLDQHKLSAQHLAFAEVMRRQAEHRVELSSAAANPAEEITKLWRYLAGHPITKAYISEYIKLAELALVMTPSSVEEERMFSAMAYLKDDTRNRLQECHLNVCARVFAILCGWMTLLCVGATAFDSAYEHDSPNLSHDTLCYEIGKRPNEKKTGVQTGKPSSNMSNSSSSSSSSSRSRGSGGGSSRSSSIRRSGSAIALKPLTQQGVVRQQAQQQLLSWGTALVTSALLHCTRLDRDEALQPDLTEAERIRKASGEARAARDRDNTYHGRKCKLAHLTGHLPQELWDAFLADAVQPRVKACNERVVIASMLLGFLVRGLCTIHVADPLSLHGQPVYTDIPVSLAAIPDLSCKNLCMKLCRGLPGSGANRRLSAALAVVLAAHPDLRARLEAIQRYHSDTNMVEYVRTQLERAFSNMLTLLFASRLKKSVSLAGAKWRAAHSLTRDTRFAQLDTSDIDRFRELLSDNSAVLHDSTALAGAN
ncbi:hypothetical protein QJQ45_026342, partial [Haematococcus lacustris]